MGAAARQDTIGARRCICNRERKLSQNRSGTDLRVRRTRKLLREALIDLATEKGFEAITI